MVTVILELTCDGLLAFVIVRGAREKLFFAYPVFYTYLVHVLVLDLFRFYIYTFWPNSYREVYWYCQFLSLVIGYCVIWEIYTKSLNNYQGVLQISRALVSTGLIVVVSRFLNNALVGPIWGTATTVVDLERNMRALQAMLLITLLGLVFYYGVPLGRNLWGIICGYAFFVGTSIIHLTLRSYLGDAFQSIWTYLPSISYFLALVIWCAALRSYQSIPKPETDIRIEQDYEALVEHTVQSLARATRLIVRMIRV